MTFLVTIGLGIVMLIAGRKLFWLFVGVVGFTVCIGLAERFFPGESETTLLVLALITGVLFAVLALFLKKVAVGVAGFVAGGYMATYIVSLLNLGIDLPTWILVLIGGVIGAVLESLMDWFSSCSYTWGPMGNRGGMESLMDWFCFFCWGT